MRLKREAFRHIEAEIFAYHDTLKYMQELRKNLTLGTEYREEKGLDVKVSGGGYVGSAVERRATKLADHVMLREMERITDAIYEVYSHAKDECREVVYLKYGLKISWAPPKDLVRLVESGRQRNMKHDALARKLNMAERTFFRYKNGFVYGVAEKIGWW